ncbi:glycoside hydrolase family 5 protein [Auriscalpium vulgare]|uniref:Glycoside hydrolase family 5 protein n=1 Tax=Auriscalpium vulgare TaxID=40419 RepID=A0ACB8SDR3_9AGAM|nr:glycoside hydrolase family 5 protein [Auriscalpium vulgare]
MRPSSWLPAVLGAALVAATPTPTIQKRWPTAFASVADGGFSLNGSKFSFIGTNAYWLPYLNSDEDIVNTLTNMSAAGIKVVRTWAFNDVTSVPTAGSWLQLIQNGTTTINDGPNGLQRLDRLVELAEQHGIYVLLSLTNNWNPVATPSSTPARRDDTASSATPLPRNFLSNDYGGMDAYVREFGTSKTHDEFYTDPTIRTFFEKYVQAVVSRFANNPFVFAWELANDPRCNSTIPTSPTCTTQTITQWHADLSKFIRSIDPNHLVSSGDHGFLCPTCTKLFPLTPKAAPSAAAGGASTRRRSRAAVMTKARLIKKIAEDRRAAPRAADAPTVKIRGAWKAPAKAKRQENGGPGSAFDGSSGVDSQDILNAPDIGFGSFQLLPDQNNYDTNPNDAIVPPSANFGATVQQGINWIQTQAASAQAVGKPLVLTAFGLVTQANEVVFVPFNASTPVNPGAGVSTRKRQTPGELGTGVTDDQRDDAYTAWLNAGIQAGLQGMTQYQWSSVGLTPSDGTFVQSPNAQQQTAGGGTLPQSPNDGYGTLGQAQNAEQGVLQDASQNITSFLLQ